MSTECKPQNCPIMPWATLSRTERKEQRRTRAAELAERGFTEKDIAALLGVSQQQISKDLSNLQLSSKLKPAKTATNPKGAGRPKGSTKPRTRSYKSDSSSREKAGSLHLDLGFTRQEIVSQTGMGEHEVQLAIEYERGRREAQPTITPDMLSMTAQQKLDVAIRQATRKLEVEIEMRCREDLRRWLNEVTLPQYAKELGALERSIRERKGVMDRVTYRKILACLHPDRVHDPALKKRYEEAFRLFTELEKRVLDEKESPTEFRKMPRTYEELMAMKAKVQADRRAKRGSKVSVR